MPYRTIAELPDAIKNALPEAAQGVFVRVVNRCLADGDSEESAFRQAWAAVKNGWEKKGGEWVAKHTEQSTITLRGEEVFSAGEYNGDEYTEADLDDMVEAFKALKGRLDPPVKLGHNDKQADAKEFEREDGKPALGWIENLRRQGKKLIADFVQVPQKIAEAIKAGGYKKKSAEIYWNFKDAGKTYRRALKAVALLGADVPANRDIASLSALYDEQGNEYRRAEYGEDASETVTLEDIDAELESFCAKLASATKGRVGAPAIRHFLAEVRGRVKGLVEGRRDHAEWSAAEKNDLPDVAFAVIRPGGKKDEDGKTVPRSLRLLPHHGPDVESPMHHESVDLPYLRNAMSQLPQAEMSGAERRQAMQHLQAHAKAMQMSKAESEGFAQLTKEVSQQMSELDDLTRKYAEMETQNKTLAEQIKGFADKLAAVETKAAEAEAARTKAETTAKDYAERLGKAEEAVATERKTRRLVELRSVAAGFPNIPGTSGEKADKLYRLEVADPNLYEERVAEWKTLDAQLAAGDITRQYAHAGDNGHDDGAAVQLDKLIAEALKNGRAKNLSEATALVCSENPRLYTEAQAAHTRRAERR